MRYVASLIFLTTHDGASVFFKRVFLCFSAVALLTISAKVQVPFYPVPMTLQVMSLMTIGCFLSRTSAFASLSTYVLLGAFGLPLFATGGGIAYLLGPTGGYIFGFFPCLWIFSSITTRSSAAVSALLLLCGVATIYACGLLWLGVSIGWNKPLLSLGLFPFIGGDLAKAFVVWGLLRADRKTRVRSKTRSW